MFLIWSNSQILSRLGPFSRVCFEIRFWSNGTSLSWRWSAPNGGGSISTSSIWIALDWRQDREIAPKEKLGCLVKFAKRNASVGCQQITRKSWWIEPSARLLCCLQRWSNMSSLSWTWARKQWKKVTATLGQHQIIYTSIFFECRPVNISRYTSILGISITISNYTLEIVAFFLLEVSLDCHGQFIPRWAAKAHLSSCSGPERSGRWEFFDQGDERQPSVLRRGNGSLR